MSSLPVCWNGRWRRRLTRAFACLLVVPAYGSPAAAHEEREPWQQPLVFAGKAKPGLSYEVRAIAEDGGVVSSFPVYAGDGEVLSGDTLRLDGAVALQTAAWRGDELIAESPLQEWDAGALSELILPDDLGYLLIEPVEVSVIDTQVNDRLRRYSFELRGVKGQLLEIDPALVKWSWPMGPEVIPPIPKPPFCPGTACFFVPERPKERLIAVLNACLGPLCGAAVSTTPPSPSGWKSVTVGQGFSCGLSHQGRVLCWGEGIHRDLGYAPNRPCVLPPTAPTSALCSQVPKEIVQPPGSLGSFQSLDAGDHHVCAIDTAGDMWCWGELSFAAGSLCPGGAQQCHRSPFRLTPRDPSRPASPARLKAVSAGGRHTCALTTDGSALCFGGNAHGEAGSLTPGVVFSAVGPLAGYQSISSGAGHTCALTLAGRVECWGFTLTLSSLPPQVPNAERFLGFAEDVMARYPSITAGSVDRVSAGQFRTCVHDTRGTLACLDESGILPMRVEQIDPITLEVETSIDDRDTKCQIESGNLFCDLRQTGGLHAPLLFSTPLVDSSVEFFHGCAVESTGPAWCWGDNDQGQLGDGTIDPADPGRPTAVLPP